MERIKKALEEARAAREQTLKAELERLVQARARAAAGGGAGESRFDPATDQRIREFMPLRGLPADRLQAAMALGQVFGLGSGELVFAAGDRHVVHVLVRKLQAGGVEEHRVLHPGMALAVQHGLRGGLDIRHGLRIHRPRHHSGRELAALG